MKTTPHSLLKFPLALLALMFSGLLLLNGCKKDDEIDNGEEEQTLAGDDATFQAELDQAEADVDDLAANGAFDKNASITVCGASVDSTSTPGTYILNFDSSTACVNGTRLRSGRVEYRLTTGNAWADAGAVLEVKFVNYRVSILATGLTYTLNGTGTITNVTGGLVANLVNGGSSITRIRQGSFSFSFPDGGTRSWDHHVQRVWSRSNNLTSVSITGLGSSNGNTGLSSWGTSRFGNAFSVQIVSPLVIRQDCGAHRPISGQKKHYRAIRDFTVTFGLDSSGNPATSGCPTSLRVEWINKFNGNTGTALVTY